MVRERERERVCVSEGQSQLIHPFTAYLLHSLDSGQDKGWVKRGYMCRYCTAVSVCLQTHEEVKHTHAPHIGSLAPCPANVRHALFFSYQRAFTKNGVPV